jgi:hypothetical protein
MKQTMKSLALLVMLMLVVSGLALSQDYDRDDGGYYGGNAAQSRQYGYQNGYRDGLSKGRHEGRENDPNDYRDPNWRQATAGYERWMGPVNSFQQGYRDGYQNGFRAGYVRENRRHGDGDGDADDRGHGGYYPYGGANGGYSPVGRYGSPAYQIGYQDGANVAREDISSRKPFNPNPRGKYDDEDHGYSSRYGSKRAYQAEYASGYRSGYQSARRY